MAEIHVFPDLQTLAQNAAERIVALAHTAITRDGQFTIGLSGGSTPEPLFALLARDSFANQIDWAYVHVFWGDERCVPPDHADSNFRMAQETLLSHVLLPENNVYRMKGELDPAQAAEEYEHRLRMFFGVTTWPHFDLLLQGMGNDGHTASLFPGTTALHEETRWVAANYVPKLDSWRLTLTVPAINAAAHIMFLVAGANKAPALKTVLQGPSAPDEYPAQRIAPENGDLLWLVDAAAAAAL